MRERMLQILKYTFSAIGISCLLFLLIGICFDVSFGGTFTMEGYTFTKMAVGCIVVGLGFGLPCMVYLTDRLAPAVQSLIHMGIGCVVMTIVAFVVGWIPLDHGAGMALLCVAGEIGAAIAIWALIYQWEKAQAKQMNRKIQDLQRKG